MSLDIHPQFQNSTFNSTNSSGTYGDDFFTLCKDMYEGVVFVTCVSLVSVLCGFPACVAVLWELLQRHRRGVPATPNDVFMLNLTAMDLVFLSFTPLGVCNYMLWHIWPIEHIYMFIYAAPAIGRPLFTTCICLDCYLAVVHPLTYRARKGLTPRVLMSIGVWVATLVYGGLYVIFNLQSQSEIEMKILSVLVCVFTIVTVVICDFFILRALKSSGPGGRDLHPQKKKALQIIINSLVMTVIAYFPPLLSFFFYTFMSTTELICKVIYPVYCSVIAGSAIMPILYLSNLNKLDFFNLWCCKAD